MNLAAAILMLLTSNLCQATSFDNPRNGKVLTIITCPIEHDQNAPLFPDTEEPKLDPKKRT